MARLGRSERGFCKDHGLPESRLFDASGMKRAEYREVMKRDEKWAAYGVTPCAPHGHVLRNRHGTCLMCDTARLAYLFRTKMSGYLYVATSASGGLVKLGFSNDPRNRLDIANWEHWGGYSDWRLVAMAWDEKAGRLEHEFHAAFSEYCVPLEWERNWRTIISREAFRIGVEPAITRLVWLCDGPTEVMF